MFLDIGRAMVNVQKHNICTDDRSSVQKVSERLALMSAVLVQPQSPAYLQSRVERD